MTDGRITDEARWRWPRSAGWPLAWRTGPTKPVAPASRRRTDHGGRHVAGHAIGVPGLLAGALTDLFGLVESGALRAVPGGEYAMSEARLAHEALRSRGTVGKLMLDPTR